MDVNLRVDRQPQAAECLSGMSCKTDKIAALTKAFEGQRLDAHYLGFFECFNRQRFFEAHEVLEALWLPVRQGPDGAFYKGLIQLAGAFVHVQNRRSQPALALLKLAQTNLQQFPRFHQGLDLASVLKLIEHWMGKVAEADSPAATGMDPRLPLPDAASRHCRHS
jgi:uncharacterized protein